jgi:hypothetical protein
VVLKKPNCVAVAATTASPADADRRVNMVVKD